MVPHDKRGCGLRSSAAPVECQGCEVCWGEWLGDEGFLELAITALPTDEDLAFPNLPHHKSGDAGVAAKQRVAGQIGVASASGSSPSPAIQRATSRPASSSSVTAPMLASLPPPPEKANQGGGSMPAVDLRPHLLAGKQLVPAGVQAGGMRLAAWRPLGVRHISPGGALHVGQGRCRHPRALCRKQVGFPRNRLVWQRKPGHHAAGQTPQLIEP